VAQSPHFSLLQSYEWGEFKERLGWKAIRVAVARQGHIIAGAQLLIRPFLWGLASFAYIPRGPLLNWEDTKTATVLLDALHKIACQHRALFLRIEPPLLYSARTHLVLQHYGFQATKQTNQPRCTLVLNLQADLDTLFAMLPKKTRYHIRAASRKGVVCHQGRETDLPAFYRLMKITSQRAGFTVRSPRYYEQEFKTFVRRNQTNLFLADHEAETIAVEMAFVFGQCGATLHGASSNTQRHLTASDLLTWEGISWAKKQGCRSYDLWGIPDEVGELMMTGKPIPKDKHGGLWGVYYFKKGFGGEVVYYVGAYDYVYNRPAYLWMKWILSQLEARDAPISFMDRR
jgi:peptidoglycan pentaglycine glycine transferase (the first glycine)